MALSIQLGLCRHLSHVTGLSCPARRFGHCFAVNGRNQRSSSPRCDDLFHAAGVRDMAPEDQRRAIGIQAGLKLVMIQAPPKATSPAYTICGSMAMSAEMSPTIAPSTDWTAFNRSLATL
jgi:hypothetical protein